MVILISNACIGKYIQTNTLSKMCVLTKLFILYTLLHNPLSVFGTCYDN